MWRLCSRRAPDYATGSITVHAPASWGNESLYPTLTNDLGVVLDTNEDS